MQYIANTTYNQNNETSKQVQEKIKENKTIYQKQKKTSSDVWI